MHNMPYRLFTILIQTNNNIEVLQKSVQSILNQTIGFEENINVILFEGCSNNETYLYCKDLEATYPSNIKFILHDVVDKDDLLKHINSRYANFNDLDGIWDEHALEMINDYFDNHYDEIDVLACRIVNREKTEKGKHPLDYKFTKNKIVPILEKHKQIQCSVSSSIIKSSALVGEHETMMSSAWKNLLFLTSLIMDGQKYGILKDAEYILQEDVKKDSFSDTDNENLHDGIRDFANICKCLFKLSIEKYGEIIPYIQYLVAYGTKDKVRNVISDSNTEEQSFYCNLLHEVVDKIDDRYFIEQNKDTILEKAYVLLFKNGVDGADFTDLVKKAKPVVDILDIREGRLFIAGRNRSELFGQDWEMYLETSRNQVIPLSYELAACYDVSGCDPDITIKGQSFSVSVDCSDIQWFSFVIRNKKTNQNRKAGIYFGMFSRLSNLDNSYFCSEDRIYSFRDDTFYIEKNNIIKQRKYANRYNTLLKESNREDIVSLRLGATELRKKSKPIWLFVDRTDRADENAEVLFEFLQQTEAKNKYRLYFAIAEDSEDYQRVKEYGKVLDYGSEEYKKVFLAADKLISSQWAFWLLNPFGEDREYYQDLIASKFVFLQHGIILNDSSAWGYRNKRNIRLFVTSAEKEYNSILSGNYGYKENEIILTGLPRYDRLNNRPQRVVLFMPTWRKNMNLNAEKGSYKLEYSDSFAESEYFAFYNALINDSRILDSFSKNGYIGKFVIHPLFANYAKCFQGNSIISIQDLPFSYRDLFEEGALMITDYSSVSMDFAYLSKPIIYSQFDKESFYRDHTCTQGYFSYDNDGFGPVCTSYETTVQAILEYINNDCVMEDKYVNRVKQFFAFTDQNNCNRIYKAIERL